MRFLLGLICGAAATLFAAAALNGSPASLADAVAALMEDPAVEKILPPMPAAAKPPREIPEDPIPVPLPKPDTPAQLAAAEVPIEAPPSQEETSDEPMPEPPPLDTPMAVPPPEVTEPMPTAQPPAAQGELVVWTPFYSEASARGFAGRLVRELDVPFEVRKAGPSQYLVTASYRDAQERSAIEARVATMTGGTP